MQGFFLCPMAELIMVEDLQTRIGIEAKEHYLE